MKKLMGIVAAILILAGGAVAAMKWLAIGPFEVAGAIEEEKEPEEETILIEKIVNHASKNVELALNG